MNPIVFERDNHIEFKKIFKDVVVMTEMIMLRSKYLIEGETRKICDQKVCNVSDLKKNTISSNLVKISIQTFDDNMKRDIVETPPPPLILVPMLVAAC